MGKAVKRVRNTFFVAAIIGLLVRLGKPGRRIALQRASSENGREFAHEDPAETPDLMNQEELHASPPNDPKEDPHMGKSSKTPDQPDAGKIPFSELAMIVEDYRGGLIDADSAVEKVRDWRQKCLLFLTAEGDRNLVERRANEALEDIEVMRIRLKANANNSEAKPGTSETLKHPNDVVNPACDEHSAKPAPQHIVIDINQPTPPSGGNGNGEDHPAGNNGRGGGSRAGALAVASNAGGWGLMIGLLGIAAAILIVGLFVALNTDFGDDDDNNHILTAADRQALERRAEELRGEEPSGDPNGSNGGTLGGGSQSINVKSIAELGKVVTSSTAGGGPNLDGIYTGDCEVLQTTPDRIMFRSGELGICTQHISTDGLEGWQLVADSVYHEVNGKSCTGCTQGFDLKDLPKEFDVTIKNGAMLLGVPSVARDRYCTAVREGFAYGHFNVNNVLPLAGWAESCK